MAWVLDLDGVVWLDDVELTGSREAVARLRAAGEAVAFVTNNAYRTRAETEERLRRLGIEPQGGVISSAMAVATLVEPGERVLLCAGPGVREAMAARRVELVDADDGGTSPVDAVVVGLHTGFDYAMLGRAAAAVRAGARFLASNTDATYPTPTGLAPGAGSIVAAVSTAAGRAPEAIAGKPHAAMAALVREAVGAAGVVVGDRLDTDARFAEAMGFEFALVLSGVTTAADAPFDPVPASVAPDLLAAVRERLGGC